MEVGLVDVAAHGGNVGRGVTCREEVSRVVEPHQSSGVFGRDAKLGPEARRQALTAPADLLRQALDPSYDAAGGDWPQPGRSTRMT
ncbi:hypothetical protein GCM10009548_50150 [Streptomyces malaysiensis subsp. malaysiensis]